MKFYQLEHIRYYDDNVFSNQKIIGTYSTRDIALMKLEEYRNKEGFKNHPSGFSIREYEIDTIYFQDGFIDPYKY